MKPKQQKDYDRRANQALKALILRFQDYENNYPEDFKSFLLKSSTKRSLEILNTFNKN